MFGYDLVCLSLLVQWVDLCSDYFLVFSQYVNIMYFPCRRQKQQQQHFNILFLIFKNAPHNPLKHNTFTDTETVCLEFTKSTFHIYC